jgi:hypothetical protein
MEFLPPGLMKFTEDPIVSLPPPKHRVGFLQVPYNPFNLISVYERISFRTFQIPFVDHF